MTASGNPPRTSDALADAAGERLDVFVARRWPEITRSRARKLIESGDVRVDGRAERASYRLSAGERVSVTPPPPAAPEALPEAIALDVVYEDADIIAINKPAGMTVHPAPGHPRSTLVNAILAHCGDLSGVGGVLRPGIVHRLDRDTSGIILVAKNDAAHNDLARQWKERSVEKVYLALVEGTPRPPEGVIDAPVARDPRSRQRMAIVPGGREAQTAYRVVERFAGAALVEARPKTGRTHQIRVHLAAIGHPIVGDRVYGTASRRTLRQLLHAARITFTHPRTGERMTLEAPLAPDFAGALEELRRA
ncbi:MAG TPA: RluA family pseudouridine synthase [Dehalococcoidia bacterium]|nr:RluA family pseudouridine synthase [Dehalococcoidia bacterium]